jgi:hypothetical protein
MAIAYEELDESPQEDITPESFKATIQVKCTWADRYDVMNHFAWGEGQVYPRWPLLRARTRGMACVPFGAAMSTFTAPDGQKFLEYDHASITVNFVRDVKTPQGPSNEDLISESVEPATEFMTTNPEFYHLGSTKGPAPKEGPGVLVRTLVFVLTRYNVRVVPPAVLSLVGCVNASPVVCRYLGLTFPAETLLYGPPQMQQKISTDGASGWTLTFRFTYRPLGWNKIWHSGSWNETTAEGLSPGWYSMYTGGAGGGLVRMYPTGNLQLVLQ